MLKRKIARARSFENFIVKKYKIAVADFLKKENGLGYKVKEIADKDGFSESTIRKHFASCKLSSKVTKKQRQHLKVLTEALINNNKFVLQRFASYDFLYKNKLCRKINESISDYDTNHQPERLRTNGTSANRDSQKRDKLKKKRQPRHSS